MIYKRSATFEFSWPFTISEIEGDIRRNANDEIYGTAEESDYMVVEYS